MEQLYVFDILVEHITFEDSVDPQPNKGDIKVAAIISNILNVQITSKDTRKVLLKKTIDFYTGKSVLFSSTANNLADILEKQPIDFSICEIESGKAIGTASATLPKDFANFVKIDVRRGSSKSVANTKTYDIVDKNNKKIAAVSIVLELINFGKNIEADHQVIPIALTSFQTGRAVPSPLSSGSSATPLFVSTFSPRKSHMEKELKAFAQDAGVMPNYELTPDYISDMLCGHNSCPGARRFRDLGLGPLAPKGAGLGTVALDNAKARVSYGLSQTYGTMENYGPFGLLQKTKGKGKGCGSPYCPTGPGRLYAGADDADTYKDKNRSNSRKSSRCLCSCKNKSEPCNSTQQFPKINGKKISRGRLSAGADDLYFDCEGNFSYNINRQFSNISGKEMCRMPYLRPGRLIAGADNNCADGSCPYSTSQNRRSFSQAQTSSGECGGGPCPSGRNGNRGSFGANNFSQSPANNAFGSVPCPYSSNPVARGGSFSQGGNCGGRTCPISQQPTGMGANGYNQGPYQQPRGSLRYSQMPMTMSSNNYEQNNICGGQPCPLLNQQPRSSVGYNQPRDSFGYNQEPPYTPMSSNGYDDICGGQPCPSSQHGGEERRSSYRASFDPSSFQKPKNKGKWNDKTCPFITKRNSLDGGEDCPFAARNRSKPKNCGDDECPYGTKVQSEEGYYCGDEECQYVTSRLKRLSILETEGESDYDYESGRKHSRKSYGSYKMSVTTNVQELLETLNSVPKGRKSCSMTNYYSIDTLQYSQGSEPGYGGDGEDGQDYAKPRTRRGPCKRDTCKALKYKTCSECGGVSRSGATCDNQNVSFSTISYSDSYYEGYDDEGEADFLNLTRKIAGKKKPSSMTDTETADKQTMVPYKKNKRRSRFVYNVGEYYPGIRVGHKWCRFGGKNVPAHMGWLWNIEPEGRLKKRKGWKPGVLSKVINDRIVARRRELGIPDPPELKMLLGDKKKKTYAAYESSDEEDEVVQKPTLTIRKKDGCYWITMYPLKDPKSLADREDPYMNCTPLEFVIVKNKKDDEESLIKHSSNMDSEYKDCLCDEDLDIVESSSSESELNIEFTTPAGLIVPELMVRKPDVIHVETQFKEEDFNCADCPIIIPKVALLKKKKGKKK